MSTNLYIKNPWLTSGAASSVVGGRKEEVNTPRENEANQKVVHKWHNPKSNKTDKTELKPKPKLTLLYMGRGETTLSEPLSPPTKNKLTCVTSLEVDERRSEVRGNRSFT
ncbi:hypothetical protein JTE90_011912 [Oedothorax gibbosus]|uniref:Uncharacterized protein n=1 Tax=Oedothorax gibbosus TaxID=931172 RepID=A0AAV6V2V2_9ARAC|nr:hypothetical protein JTE90_011912 [Oedothorax gibbosus]